MGCDVAGLITILINRGQTLSVCESLTGGGIGAALTSVPGSSAVFRGGLITYATCLKAELLGLDKAFIDRYGVVSAQVVAEMATRTRSLCFTDWSIAVTGVAGPDSQAGKAPGTVFIGVASAGLEHVVERHFEGEREQIRQATIRAALGLLAERLSE